MVYVPPGCFAHPNSRAFWLGGGSGTCCVWVCRGCLLHTDPQERAKTTTASSGCRPRPTAPDPVVLHVKQLDANEGEASGGKQ
jgi:hypothetical protein